MHIILDALEEESTDESGNKVMKKKKLWSCFLAVTCAASLLSGCGNQTSTEKKENAGTAAETSDHEAITINAPYQNISAFIDKVHEKYPEINIEVVPYSGSNTTAWMQGMLNAGELTDIYFTTFYSAGNEDVSGKLLDVSGYDFTENYVQSRLREVTVDGAVYMLPLFYGCYGITYNKTLLEENGWELPTSLRELEELAPKVKEAGYNLCLDMYQYPGYGFQYLCNILDTGYLSTLDGLQWQADFLDGKANIEDTPEMLENMNVLERWREIGMLNDLGDVDSDDVTEDEMLEGNTLFLIGSTNDLSTGDEQHDEFRMMPYLSEDGKQNVFILNVNRYVGLNQYLADEGNEQKLEDALHVMEVLSTEDGMWSLNAKQKDTALLPLKDVTVSEDSYYADVLEYLNEGHTAPFIYSGWENIVVPLGQQMIDFARGDSTLEDVIACMDENQSLITDNSAVAYTQVTETLDTDDCARLVGISFAQAVDADAALVSENVYYPEEEEMNRDGVSGALFALPVTEQELVSIVPTGWNGNIQTVTLTGARIKELTKEGYDRTGAGYIYPYALVTRDGEELDDDTTYTVVICGATEEVQQEGNIQDSRILGLDAAKEYFTQFESLSKKDIVWK